MQQYKRIMYKYFLLKICPFIFIFPLIKVILHIVLLSIQSYLILKVTTNFFQAPINVYLNIVDLIYNFE